MAKKSGLTTLAITDHDCISGLEEAALEAIKVGIEFIPGIEFSAKFKTSLHILGYFPNGGFNEVKPLLDVLKKSREERNPKIIKKLDELGYPITMEHVLAHAGTPENVSRVHYAKALVERGYAVSIREAFHRLLGDYKPAYVDKEDLTPQQVIEAINTAGGVSVLAHPILIKLNLDEIKDVIVDLKSLGLMGVEAYYSENKPKETKYFVKLASELGLIATGGSDYHGIFKPHLDIGIGAGDLKVPTSCAESIINAANRKAESIK
jgi:predicted metal-dependent phosphoesterase TrpH